MALRSRLLVLCIVSCSTCAFAQDRNSPITEKLPPVLPPPSEDKDLIDFVKHRLHVHMPAKPRKKKKLNFSFIPVATGTAAGNKVLVSSINAAFILGDPDSTKVSSVYFLPYTNFYKNFGFGTKPNIWTANNNWNIPGEFRISHLAQYTYGVGSHSSTTDRVQLNYKNIRMYVTGNRKLFTNFFAGFGFQFDRYYNISQSGSATQPSSFEKYPIGTTGTTSFSSGITMDILHDSRKNSINASDGLYYALIYRFNPTFMTNPTHWTSLYADVRKYFVIPSEKRKILALWGIYWGSYGNVPYFNLPGTQLELAGRSGRGFAQGRFRGKELLYLESEYRFDISDNKFFGGVLFVNAQSYKEPSTNRFQYVNPAAGFGVRIKFNKLSDTNLTIDFAGGKNSFNFYIGLGEFF